MSDDWKVGLLVAILIFVFFGILFAGYLIEQRNYYDCVYAMKGASTTPSDIHLICRPHR